jgi:ubiquinone/menaquinone biosynthesis C-methylase UbiE
MNGNGDGKWLSEEKEVREMATGKDRERKPGEEPAKFDGWANKYDQWFQTPRGALVYTLEKDLILSLARPRKGEKALDVGCGTGNFTLALVEKDLDLYGLDVSEKMLAIAARKIAAAGHKVVFHHGTMERIPLADNYFDLVLCVTALESSREPEQAVAEMCRVTRPGGRMVIAVLNADSPWAVQRRRREKGSIWEDQHFYSPGEFLTLLSRVTGVPAGEIEWNSSVFFGPHPTDAELEQAWELEGEGRERTPEKGALLAARVDKPLVGGR